MKINTICALFLFISVSVSAQFQILKDIGNSSFGSPDPEVSGLGQIFSGQMNPEKTKLMFSAAPNGYDYQIWQTDGTSVGTTKAVDVKDVENIYYLEGGIFLEAVGTGDDLHFSKWNTTTATGLPFFNGKKFGTPYQVGNKYLIAGETQKVYITDGTNAGSKEVYTFTKEFYNKITTTGDSVAVIYHDAFTPEFTPVIYDLKTDKASTLIEYMAGLKTFSAIDYAFCAKDVIIMRAIENNAQKHYAYNVKTKKLASFEFTRKLNNVFVMNNGDYLILTTSDLFRFDPINMTYKVLSSYVNPFSSYHFENDKLIFLASTGFGGTPNYYETDGTAAGTRALTGATISDDDYESKSLVANNKMYFTKQYGSFFDPTTHLMSYNFTTKKIDSLGLIREEIGSLTTIHALYAINNKIVVSRYTKANGHEIYSFTGSVNTKDHVLSIVNIFPTLANNTLSVTSDQPITNISIFNSNSSIAQSVEIDSAPLSRSLNISYLQPGIYYAVITIKNGSSITKKFVKQ